MSAQSPQEFREEVRARSEIVGLIGESVALQPRSGGREYVGLCPFHDDHNPSMRVYPDRQTFRCWSCNTGGDCFAFVMEREKVTFPEALEILARRAHIELPKFVTGQSPQQENNRARLFEALQWAEETFHRCLLEAPEAAPARDYLQQRGVTPEMVRRFRLGFHPNEWTWLLQKARATGKFSQSLLIDARVAGERDGRAFDFFVNRVLFPIHNERGQTVSFGGRILPGSQDDAKYWNGPESPVFHKSRLLFAIDKARDAIREQDQALIVEGYTDCIACHQFGVQNVVGTLGTALTDSHVTAIKRFTRKVVLVFDGDAAGQAAAARAVERFLAQDVDLRILTLPEGQDPADFLAASGAEAFRQLAETAPEAWDFRFRLAREKHGVQTLDGRGRILEEMLAVLAQVPALATSVREPLLIANLSQRLSVPEVLVRRQLQQVRTGGPRLVRVENHAVESRPYQEQVRQLMSGRLKSGDHVECDLLQMLLAAPEQLHFIEQAVEEYPLRHRLLSGLLRRCFEELEERGTLTVGGLLDRLSDPDVKCLLVWLDEQAHAKGLAQKINESESDAEGCPRLLRQVLNALQKREAEHSLAPVAIQLSQSTDGRTAIDPATEALLRQAAEFHQKRATNKMGTWES